MINPLLGNLIDVCFLVYVEDILIYSAMAEDYTRHLWAIFGRLAKIKVLPEM